MLIQNCNSKPPPKASSALLRDDHVVILAIDAVLALHASFKRWRKRRRTLRALAGLDERQLRDIGLTRRATARETASAWLGRDKSYRVLAELDDDQLVNLSDLGRQIRREAQHARSIAMNQR
jgi:uncharacterized protein YjiS (DUF1127 family)